MCCFVSLNLSFSLFHTQTVSLKEIDISLLFFLLSSFPLQCHLMVQQISNVPKHDVALPEPFQPRTGSSQNPVLVEGSPQIPLLVTILLAELYWAPTQSQSIILGSWLFISDCYRVSLPTCMLLHILTVSFNEPKLAFLSREKQSPG